MKPIYTLILSLFACLGVHAQTGTVSFNYDDDGNMKQRLVVTVPAHVKTSQNPNDSVPKPVVDDLSIQQVVIYPNPTKGQFQINILNLDEKAKNYCLLFSASGTRLLSKDIVNSTTGVDITRFPVGTYLLDIFLGNKVSRWKIIKQ